MDGPMPLGGALPSADMGQPTPTIERPQNPTRPNTSISGQWTNWISRPENRAAMIQAGVQLLQPISPGQSLGGHVGRAIAGGVGAQSRNIQSRADQDLALRKMANEEAETVVRGRAVDADKNGQTYNQRFGRWIDFLNKQAEAMANQKLMSGEGVFSMEEMRQEIINNPQMSQQLYGQFQQEEQRLGGGGNLPGLAQTTAPVGGKPRFNEGDLLTGPDGREYIVQGGKPVATGR